MDREERIDWLCKLRIWLNNVGMYKEWRAKFDQALADAIKESEQQPCEDAISRQEVEKLLSCGCADAIWDLPSVTVQEKTGDYKQGWHDAIEQALKETHSILTEDGPFRVVQEETLIGVGMAYEPQQRVGRWNIGRIFPTKIGGENLIEYRCAECDRVIRCTQSQLVNYPYCHCGAKMGVE